MTTWVAFLRAVNVGGTGSLLMRDLRVICKLAGLDAARTHGASGNVVFESDASEEEVRAALLPRLEAHLGRPVGLTLRSADALKATLAELPFPGADPSRAVVIFLDDAPPPDALDAVTGGENEVVRQGPREFFVHYPDGMGRSRLRIPAAREGTARNINTLRRVVELADRAV